MLSGIRRFYNGRTVHVHTMCAAHSPRKCKKKKKRNIYYAIALEFIRARPSALKEMCIRCDGMDSVEDRRL